MNLIYHLKMYNTLRRFIVVPGRFIVPLPKKPHAPLIGETKLHAVQRFLSLERSMLTKGNVETSNSVMQEYFDMKHAEPVPTASREASPQCVLSSHACGEEGIKYHNKDPSSI